MILSSGDLESTGFNPSKPLQRPTRCWNTVLSSVSICTEAPCLPAKVARVSGQSPKFPAAELSAFVLKCAMSCLAAATVICGRCFQPLVKQRLSLCIQVRCNTRTDSTSQSLNGAVDRKEGRVESWMGPCFPQQRAPFCTWPLLWSFVLWSCATGLDPHCWLSFVRDYLSTRIADLAQFWLFLIITDLLARHSFCFRDF